MLHAVREIVRNTLCSRDNLREDCFEMSEHPLSQANQLCGWHFCLYGPRQSRLTAIWDIRANKILYYGSQGERFLIAAAP